MDFKVNGVKLGIQSYAIREYNTIESACEAMKELGLDTLELCSDQCNFDNKAECEHVLEVCKEYGITISTIGVEEFTARDSEKALNRFEFAKAAGCKYIGCDPDCDPETVAMVEELCNKYGIKVIMHNHGQNHRYGKYEQIDDLLSKYSDNLGLHVDCAWALDAGIDPVEMIKKYSNRVHGIHLKDFLMKEDGTHDEMILGEGSLNLKELMLTVETLPEFGVMSIEYEAPNPVENLKKCIRNVIGQVTVNNLSK